MKVLCGVLAGVSVTMSAVVFIFFSFTLGVVSWAVAAILMAFAATAAFSISSCLKIGEEE
jgi:hypothetical protein